MLDIDWTTEEPTISAGQLLVVPLQQGGVDSVAQRFGAAVGDALGRSPFKGKAGETFGFTREAEGALQHVMLVGIPEGSEPATLRQLGHDAAREAQRVGGNHVVIDLRELAPEADASSVGDLLAQGLEIGTYAYDRFLSESNRRPVSLTRVSAWARSTAPAEGTTHSHG